MICLLFWVSRMVNRAIVIWMWIFSFHSGALLVMWFTLWSTGVLVIPMWSMSWGFIGWAWMWQFLSLEWCDELLCVDDLQCGLWNAMVRLMAITPVCGIGTSWVTPVMVAIIPMSWSRVASIGIMTTWGAMSVNRVWDLEQLCLSLSS